MYEWVEPFLAGPEPVVCRMKEADIISAYRNRADRPEYKTATEEEILHDFTVVHWAYKV